LASNVEDIARQSYHVTLAIARVRRRFL